MGGVKFAATVGEILHLQDMVKQMQIGGGFFRSGKSRREGHRGNLATSGLAQRLPRVNPIRGLSRRDIPGVCEQRFNCEVQRIVHLHVPM